MQLFSDVVARLNSNSLTSQTLQGIQSKNVALKICDIDTSAPYILVKIDDNSFGYVFIKKY